MFSIRRYRLSSVWMLAGLTLGCSDLLVEESRESSASRDFEVAWEAVRAGYPFLEWKGIDWDSVYTSLEDRAESAQGDEVFEILFELLGGLRDGHVYFQTQGGGRVQPFIPPRMLRDGAAFSPEVVRRYAPRELQVSSDERFEFGILDGNLGYIFISGFSPHGIAGTFDEILEGLQNTDGLIIDDRSGEGGNRQDVREIVSRFLQDPIQGPPFYKLGEEIQWPPLEPRGPFQYSKPVVVLINGASYSAREIFAEWMKQLPQVTVVGETTAGGSGGYDTDAPGRTVLPSGITIRLPTVDQRRFDGLPWEEIGVDPDIRVPQTRSDIMRGKDPQLESAISLLLGGDPVN